MKQLNHKKMLQEILSLVEDFEELEMKSISKEKFTQKEAHEMIYTIGRVYSVAHCLFCKSCSKRYENCKKCKK